MLLFFAVQHQFMYSNIHLRVAPQRAGASPVNLNLMIDVAPLRGELKGYEKPPEKSYPA